MSDRIDRRTFLAGLGGLALVRCRDAPTRQGPPPPSATTQAAPGSKAAGDVLDATLERLVPGAADLGLRAYLDGQLALPHFAGMRRMVDHGAGLLEKVAVREAGGPFLALPDAEKDRLLARFQAGQVRTSFPTATWFAVLHAFALEGWLGDPRHGGNRDGAAWKSLGLRLQCPTG